MLAQQRRAFRRQVARSDACTFFNLLAKDESLDQVEALHPAHRERLLPRTDCAGQNTARRVSVHLGEEFSRSTSYASTS